MPTDAVVLCCLYRVPRYASEARCRTSRCHVTRTRPAPAIVTINDSVDELKAKFTLLALHAKMQDIDDPALWLRCKHAIDEALDALGLPVSALSPQEAPIPAPEPESEPYCDPLVPFALTHHDRILLLHLGLMTAEDAIGNDTASASCGAHMNDSDRTQTDERTGCATHSQPAGGDREPVVGGPASDREGA